MHVYARTKRNQILLDLKVVVMDDGLGYRSEECIGIQQKVVLSLLANDLAAVIVGGKAPSV